MKPEIYKERIGSEFNRGSSRKTRSRYSRKDLKSKRKRQRSN